MAVNPLSFSTTPASNSSIGGVNSAEGNVAANLNNVDRALAASIKELANMLGAAKTSGGSADAQTLTTDYSLSAYAAGQVFVFRAGYTNTGAATLNVDAIGAKSITDQAGNALAAGEITADGVYMVAYLATLDRFCLLTPYTAAGTVLANVVEDTTPQLGGQLDVNGNAIGDGTLELLKFSETASAVNEITVTNAATGGSPTLSATGDDTNIDFTLAGKGTGGLVGNFKNSTGLGIKDSDSSHALKITTSSDLSVQRTLTLVPGDADRTLTISGNATVSQDYSTSGSPQFTGIELGHASANTLTASSGNLSIEGNVVYRAGGTDVPLADGGTGASLSDPGADRIMFWDESANAVTWLTAGTGLTIMDTTIAASGSGQPTPSSSSLDVGSLALCFYKSATAVSAGNTAAGSNLELLAANGSMPTSGAPAAHLGAEQTGTWRNDSGTTQDLDGSTANVGYWTRTA